MQAKYVFNINTTHILYIIIINSLQHNTLNMTCNIVSICDVLKVNQSLLGHQKIDDT